MANLLFLFSVLATTSAVSAFNWLIIPDYLAAQAKAHVGAFALPHLVSIKSAATAGAITAAHGLKGSILGSAVAAPIILHSLAAPAVTGAGAATLLAVPKVVADGIRKKLILASIVDAGALGAAKAAAAAKLNLLVLPREKRATTSQTKKRVRLEQILKFIEKHHLDMCVERVSCELSCNPQAYGQEGKHVFSTFHKFQDRPLSQLKKYQAAAKRGETLNKDCKLCTYYFGGCKSSTPALLKLAEDYELV